MMQIMNLQRQDRAASPLQASNPPSSTLHRAPVQNPWLQLSRTREAEDKLVHGYMRTSMNTKQESWCHIFGEASHVLVGKMSNHLHLNAQSFLNIICQLSSQLHYLLS